MTKRFLALSTCLALLIATTADARKRFRRPPPQPQSPPAERYQPPDDGMSKPMRSTYQVLHAFGKA